MFNLVLVGVMEVGMVKDPPGKEDQLPMWSSPGITKVHGSDLELWSETIWAHIPVLVLTG